MGRPAFCITHEDQKTSVRLFRRLLEDAKAYREQMLILAQTAANFGFALEEIARSKAAVQDMSGVCMSPEISRLSSHRTFHPYRPSYP